MTASATAGLRAELRLLQELLGSLGRAPADLSQLTVLDCGGGTGRLAVPIAQLGAQVTVVDISVDALASLERRAAEAGVADRVRAVQGDLEELDGALADTTFDLALAHGVLDVVDPRLALTAIHDRLRPGGLTSILVANPIAAILAKVLAGELEAGLRELRAVQSGARLDAATLGERCREIGFTIEGVSGVGVFNDLIPSGSDAPETLSELEALSAQWSPFREIAARVHLLARRPARVS